MDLIPDDLDPLSIAIGAVIGLAIAIVILKGSGGGGNGEGPPPPDSPDPIGGIEIPDFVPDDLLEAW